MYNVSLSTNIYIYISAVVIWWKIHQKHKSKGSVISLVALQFGVLCILFKNDYMIIDEKTQNF